MGEIKDFPCTYDASSGLGARSLKGGDLKTGDFKALKPEFPDAFLYREPMAELARFIKEQEGACFCMLPFDHTLEAEAMGAKVIYGNGETGPRIRETVCTGAKELLELPEIDFSGGRMQETLLACRTLREEGEHVVFQVSGPFTVLNGLMDMPRLFRSMRKEPELMKAVFQRLETELLNEIRKAKEYGAEFISYADSSGGVNILGPVLAGRMVKEFTYGFLKKAEALAGSEMMILLCPKTTLALTGTGRAEFVNHRLLGQPSYGEACMRMKGKAVFGGQMCIKNRNGCLENGIFKEIKLKEEEQTWKS